MNTTASTSRNGAVSAPKPKRPSHFELTSILWDVLPSNFNPKPLVEVEAEVKERLTNFDLKHYAPIEDTFEALMRRMGGFHVYVPAGKPVSMKRGGAPIQRGKRRAKTQ